MLKSNDLKRQMWECIIDLFIEFDVAFNGLKNTSFLLDATFIKISLTCNCRLLWINWLDSDVQCLKPDIETKHRPFAADCKEKNILFYLFTFSTWLLMYNLIWPSKPWIYSRIHIDSKLWNFCLHFIFICYTWNPVYVIFIITKQKRNRTLLSNSPAT